jgi:DNA polymerase (family 10)
VTNNEEVAAVFEEMADRLEATDVAYKPRAYRRAAENIRSHPVPVADLARTDPDALEEIEGVGEAIAEKIIEYVETDAIEELEELRTELPADIVALTRVEGVGPKTVGDLHAALGVETLADLEDAAREGRIREVDGFGAKTEQNIAENVEFARETGERQTLGRGLPVAEEVLDELRASEAVAKCSVAGSIRRWRPTVGDVDVLVASEDHDGAVADFVAADRVDDVVEAGSDKAAVRAAGVRVDLRVVDPDQFGSALQYFTGSRDHNVRLRTLALDRGVSLNEYGAFDVSDVDGDEDAREGDRIAGDTEASMYEAVDLPWIPPELREDRGEIDAAREGALPDLVAVSDLRGDVHTHTEWSDGATTVEELVDAAVAFGHDYLAVTDHASGPGVVADVGLSDAELREQADVVAEVAADAPIDVFHGVEANIDAEGGISVGDDILAELDLVVASPHSGLGRTDDATDRLVRAIEHPEVDVLGHPTGRLLTRRAGLTVDPTELGTAAADNDVALEVNANPARLDLTGGAVKAAVEAGASVVVATDAHSPGEFENLRYGVHTARRGWAETNDVLNARSAAGVRAFLGID